MKWNLPVSRLERRDLFYILKYAVLLMGAAFLFLGAEKTTVGADVNKAIKEAENLLLNQDRILACTVLQRNLKKSLNKEEQRVLREKLSALSKVFFTDSGFEAFASGKDLFSKRKFPEAIEKFVESDESEKGNSDVLHYLTLSYLQSHKLALAEGTNKSALEINPVDIDLNRDNLDVLIKTEKWQAALLTSDLLLKNFADGSASSYEARGIAQLNLGLKSDAVKSFEQAILKNPNSPEVYFLLSGLKEKPASTKLLAKYVEICKGKEPARQIREFSFCVNQNEAEKKLAQ